MATGARAAGKVCAGAGFNAYLLRASAAPWAAPGLEVKPTGRRAELAYTSHHHSLETPVGKRDIVRASTVAEFAKDPEVFAKMGEEPPGPELTLYPKLPTGHYAWGLSIDLSTCVGCNACVIACQSENNIPVVGKREVARGRAMHWIRIDRYYEGGLDNPKTLHQPVTCMHCENAPCELVCPVAATVHSAEGLNEMVYNRCVGTRYCSNNCPYKVRRFNFFLYSGLHDREPEASCATPTSPSAAAASWRSAATACSASTARASTPRRRTARSGTARS